LDVCCVIVCMRNMPVGKSTVGNEARNEVAVENLEGRGAGVTGRAAACARAYVVTRMMPNTIRRIMLMTSNTFHIDAK
jgi:hypothetical protein